MDLQQFVTLLPSSRVIGSPHVQITGLCSDSRAVKPGDLFVCLPGHQVDGHDYAAQALHNGAAALVVDRELPLDAPMWRVSDCRYAMAAAAAHFFRYPSARLKLIGITGTNGKTTTAYLTEKMLEDAGSRAGLIGTVEMKIGETSYPVRNTTPDAIDLQQSFRRMLDAGEHYCVMEVSSHALQLGRVIGCNFRTAVFTNLTQDHLDYHETMDQYREAKSLLFSRLGNAFSADPDQNKYAVLNVDDPACSYYRSRTAARVLTYGIRNEADVRAHDVKVSVRGTEFRLKCFQGEVDVRMKMFGMFNVYNALASASACLLEGVPLTSIRNTLEEVSGVPGRFEAVDERQDFLLVVDYAHTPDSLENVLQTITGFAEKRVICVFGCGGDRDRTKRPLMGEIAARYADHVIVTTDNPRSEQPEQILKDIEPGVQKAGASGTTYELIVDRQEAIEKAVEMASREDVVLIAGKGHETYQEIHGNRLDFDDREVARAALRSRMK